MAAGEIRSGSGELRERASLILVGLLCLAIPVAVGVITYRRAYSEEAAVLRGRLVAGSDTEAAAVSRWLGEIRTDALAMSRSPYLARGAETLRRARDAEEVGAMRQRLRAESLSARLSDVMLVDSSAAPVVSADGGERLPDAHERLLFQRAIRERTVTVSTHGSDPWPMHLDIAVPLLGSQANAEAEAVVLERVEIDAELRELLVSSVDPEAGITTLIVDLDGPRPSVLSTGVGADESVLSSSAFKAALDGWDDAQTHLSDRDSAPWRADRLSVLTRVPGTTWAVLSSVGPQEARSHAFRDVTLSLGWSGFALLVFVGTTQIVLIPRYKAARKREREWESQHDELRDRLDFVLSGCEASLVLGDDLQVREANERAHLLYGFSPRELVGQPLEALLAAGQVKATAEHLRSMKPGDVTTCEAVHERADGMPLNLRCRVLAIETDGELTYHAQLAQARSGPEDPEDYQDKLRALAFDLARNDERERRRLAANLHDRVGQTLTLLRMQIEALACADPEELSRLANGARQTAERAIQETRTITSEISPPVLYELGLVPALDWLAERFRDRFGLDVEVDHDGSPTPPSRDVRAALFRAVQELLMNVVKHSKAASATVYVRSDDDTISITVRDDGIGFDPESLGRGRVRESFGLFSLGERLELMGGSIEVKSRPGCATIVRLEAPLWRGEGCDADQDAAG